MADVHWLFFLFFVGLLSSFFTLKSLKFRQYIFIGVCTTGALVGLYGFWIVTRGPDPLYFRALGLPLSLIVATALCFAALMLDKTFSATRLKRGVYPLLSLYFASWVFISLIAVIWATTNLQDGFLVPVWGYIYFVSIIIAFITATLSRFRLRYFQFFLPVLFIMLVLTLAENYGMATVHVGLLQSQKKIWNQPSDIFANSFLTGTVWGCFQLLAYLYFHTKANKSSLKQNVFVDKLPVAGVMLVMASLFYHFPEFEKLRQLIGLPRGIVNYSAISGDLLLIPLFLISSGWPFERDKIRSLIVGLTMFCAAAGVSLSIYNPFNIEKDKEAQKSVEEGVKLVSSWNMADLMKHRDFERGIKIDDTFQQQYMAFAESLGPLKNYGEPKESIHTLLMLPDGLYKVGFYYVQASYEKGSGAFYMRLSKRPKEAWMPRYLELFVGDLHMEINIGSNPKDAKNIKDLLG